MSNDLLTVALVCTIGVVAIQSIEIDVLKKQACVTYRALVLIRDALAKLGPK